MLTLKHTLLSMISIYTQNDQNIGILAPSFPHNMMLKIDKLILIHQITAVPYRSDTLGSSLRELPAHTRHTPHQVVACCHGLSYRHHTVSRSSHHPRPPLHSIARPRPLLWRHVHADTSHSCRPLRTPTLRSKLCRAANRMCCWKLPDA